MANAEKILRKGLYNKKDYLLRTLKNGMKCLLVSQPENGTKTTWNDEPKTAGASAVQGDENDDDSMTDGSCSSDDEESDSFAMSLSIQVGSFSDPIEAQGLAHLLEHMMFMGSKNYPAVNHFDQFLNQNAGYTNAETGCENTQFHFEVPMKYSREASQIFASLFQAPKLAKESLEKEKEAVDSEFQMSIADDDSRIQRFV